MEERDEGKAEERKNMFRTLHFESDQWEKLFRDLEITPYGGACALDNSLVSKDEVLWPPMCAVVRIIEKA